MEERISVKIIAKEHANMDSLPLRFGIHFDSDVEIELIEAKFIKVDNKYSDRHHYSAKLVDPVNPDNKPEIGYFILGDRFNKGKWTLVTAWRNDQNTEWYLSETLRRLREDKVLNPKMLLDMHPLYRRGEINSSSTLVNYLIKDLAQADILRIEASAKAAHEKYLIDVEQLKTENENLQKQSDKHLNVALEAIEHVEVLEETKSHLELLNKALEDENTQLKQAFTTAALRDLGKTPQELAMIPARQVTRVWQSKTGSTYKNIGIEATVIDVIRRGENIVLTYADENGGYQTVEDFGFLNGFVKDVYEYLTSCKEKNRRAVFILTYKPDMRMRLASDTMKLANYSSLWRN